MKEAMYTEEKVMKYNLFKTGHWYAAIYTEEEQFVLYRVQRNTIFNDCYHK